MLGIGMRRFGGGVATARDVVWVQEAEGGIAGGVANSGEQGSGQRAGGVVHWSPDRESLLECSTAGYQLNNVRYWPVAPTRATTNKIPCLAQLVAFTASLSPPSLAETVFVCSFRLGTEYFVAGLQSSGLVVCLAGWPR
jgi:hypothetical protein